MTGTSQAVVSFLGLPYLSVCSYVLSVVARDSALEPRSSNATINVIVLDENDNDPEILNIDSGVTTVEVPEVSG